MSYFGTTDWLFRVAAGEINGYSTMNKFGENPDVDTGAAEDVWDFGGLYTFSSSADIDRIISTNAGDGQLITVIGLDTSWNEVTQTATLNGQTAVSLTTSLIRVYRAYNSGSTDIAGNVSIYVNGSTTAGVVDTPADVRAYIRDGNNQTLMCVYTVPAGKTAAFLGGYVAFAKAKTATADMSWRARPFGGVFQAKSKIALTSTGSTYWNYRYGAPVVLPAKTDILIRCETVSTNDCSISGGFDLILIDD